MSVQLKFKVEPKPATLTVDRQPVTRKATEEFTLIVRNESRSDFRGQTHTGQLFDFVVHLKGQPGTVSWRYSDGKVFPQMITPVEIDAGKAWERKADWEFAISGVTDGHYTVIATFMATKETATADFEIKSVH
jgi:hypothetical protein